LHRAPVKERREYRGEGREKREKRKEAGEKRKVRGFLLLCVLSSRFLFLAPSFLTPSVSYRAFYKMTKYTHKSCKYRPLVGNILP
jgi:hypothetical protein